MKFKLEAKKEKGNKVLMTFTISDTGVGISKEKINSIYDSFSQEGISNKRKFGGLGLGLFIVNHLVELKKGKIDSCVVMNSLMEREKIDIDVTEKMVVSIHSFIRK